jgi:hypothetical protein
VELNGCPQRKDGQKTTLELIPELNQYIEPFFPKGKVHNHLDLSAIQKRS